MVKVQPERPLSLRERDRERGSKRLNEYARKLRRTSTEAERCLWRHLRARSLAGCKFRRQVIIEPYIVDFVCLDAKLVIEADGGQHSEQETYDLKRSDRLESMGYRVLRFWNHEILYNTQAVLEQIEQVLVQDPSPCPSPGGRGDDLS
ncbi:MAG: endonuclease domain-containing protein [Candidatus Thiodiazotropha lotti]|nr:endonuclease domain-containing protein [Candidatus Thiodiazotropha lotti]MCG8001899.1 endonuclease domain-containing protein [Candidatus Thiodiazotropha lotti]MCG8009665.1 endonuclease domain-containing protein [Candidatus Thiodiazotropha lotti]MCW4185517.1 endonuclease domain-containing protein [Candidatus Thiodiazotropha lotti]MCW4197258.1 endonuclease domain-containing protein [Candidatus Thiodiazotropha lotti]